MHLVQLKLNANGSTAQNALVPFSENSSFVLGWLLERDPWVDRENVFYKQMKVFIKNQGEDPENWVG